MSQKKYTQSIIVLQLRVMVYYIKLYYNRAN